jgi:hypothetical protein
LPADGVFLLVQDFLFRFGNVTAILTRHETLLLTDLAILAMQLTGLRFGHVAFFYFSVNALVLILQAIIDLITAWMFFFEVGVGSHRCAARNCKYCKQSRSNESFGNMIEAVHDESP